MAFTPLLPKGFGLDSDGEDFQDAESSPSHHTGGCSTPGSSNGFWSPQSSASESRARRPRRSSEGGRPSLSTHDEECGGPEYFTLSPDKKRWSFARGKPAGRSGGRSRSPRRAAPEENTVSSEDLAAMADLTVAALARPEAMASADAPEDLEKLLGLDMDKVAALDAEATPGATLADELAEFDTLESWYDAEEAPAPPPAPPQRSFGKWNTKDTKAGSFERKPLRDRSNFVLA